MNTLKIKLNPYKDINIASLDDKPLSPYSELNNYLKEPFLKWAHKFLDTAEREINDDYTLVAAAEEFEKLFLKDMQNDFDACKAYELDSFQINVSAKERYESIMQLAGKYGVAYMADDMKLPVYTELQLSLDNKLVTSTELENAFLIVTTNTGMVSQLASKNNPAIVVCVSGRNIVSCFGDMQYLWEIEESRLNEVLDCIVDRFAKIPVVIRIAKELARHEVSTEDAEKLALATEIDMFVSIGDIADIEVGQSTELKVKTFPEGGSLPALRLISSNTTVVTVDGLKLTALAPGKAHIDVFRNEENIPIVRKEVTTYQDNFVKNIQLSLKDTQMGIGRSQQVSITFTPADADDIASVIWEVSDKSVASVDNEGNITAISAGKVTVTAKTTKASASITLEVLPNIMNMTPSVSSSSLYVGQTQPITVTTAPGNCFDNSYEWKSSDKRVAVVDRLDDGTTIIRATGIGECVLTCVAKEGGSFTTCSVLVESTFKKRENLHSMLSVTFVCTVITLFGSVTPIGTIISVPGAVATVLFGVSAIKRNKADRFWALLLMVIAVFIAVGSVCGLVAYDYLV